DEDSPSRRFSDDAAYTMAFFPIQPGGMSHLWVGGDQQLRSRHPVTGALSGDYLDELNKKLAREAKRVTDLAAVGDELLVMTRRGLASARHGGNGIVIERVPLVEWPSGDVEASGDVEDGTILVRRNGEVLVAASLERREIDSRSWLWRRR